MESHEPRHPISYVARRSGLTTHAIRVWERRHHVVRPSRAPNNRRLYSDADIERLRLLKRITAAGHSIAHIAGLTEPELRDLAAASGPALSSATAPHPSAITYADQTPEELLERCREGVRGMDSAPLDQALLDASVSLPQIRVLDEIVAPLMRWVGEEWHAGRLRVAHEHLATAAVGRFLASIRSAHPADAPGPALVIATPSGQRHEIGAQLASCVAAVDGWRDVYLGADLPIAEIARAARDTHARAVALGVFIIGDIDAFEREVRDLRNMLPSGTAIILGGPAAMAHRAALRPYGAHCVDTLSAFRTLLSTLHGGHKR